MRVFHRKYKHKAYEIDGEAYHLLVEDPYHVFSLTDSWGFHGKPREWGSLVVQEHICRLMDRERVYREILEAERKEAELESHATKSLADEMAREMRDAVKEDTSDVLTHSMDKKNDRRRLYD